MIWRSRYERRQVTDGTDSEKLSKNLHSYRVTEAVWLYSLYRSFKAQTLWFKRTREERTERKRSSFRAGGLSIDKHIQAIWDPEHIEERAR
jgi:hypothetical protein